MKEELKNVLNRMGLTLSEEKTHVTHITEGFEFLGYRITREMGRGKMVQKVDIPKKAIKRIHTKIEEILAPNRTNESFNAKIVALNALIRGWCEYYRCTSGPSRVLNKLSHRIFWKVGHWLGKKYDISMPVVMRRYGKENTFQTKTRKLVLPREYKAKLFIAKTWHNPYTEPEKGKKRKGTPQT